jgi:hypothetical protein
VVARRERWVYLVFHIDGGRHFMIGILHDLHRQITAASDTGSESLDGDLYRNPGIVGAEEDQGRDFHARDCLKRIVPDLLRPVRLGGITERPS